jgi:hypothetical protein
LVFEHGGKITVLFRGNPEMAVGPEGEGTQFLDFGVRVLNVVFHGKAGWVVDSDVAA